MRISSSNKISASPGSVRELRGLYERRETTPVEIVSAALALQERQQPLNAFITPTPDRALASARKAEAEFAKNVRPPPLAGVPFAVKDLIDIAGIRSTYGSAIFRDRIPAASASAVTALGETAVIGKAATHEFAWGISCENPHYGPCRNPWDPDRVAGGSSGGSAVAIATGQALLALGTDTAGSVRIPAAFCGVLGFKPTYGVVPVDGIFPLSHSLDHVGVLGRKASDLALVLDAWLKHTPAPAVSRTLVERADRRWRIGLLDSAGAPPPSAPISSLLDSAVASFQELGAEVETIRFDPPADPVEALGHVQAAEAFDAHASRGLFPAHADEYGTDVRERLERGAGLTLRDYHDGVRAQQEIRGALGRLFARVDFLLSLVAPCPPPRIGEAEGLREQVLPYTVLQNLSGLPACAFPIGADEDGLPVGAQLTGYWFSDLDVLATVGRLNPDVRLAGEAKRSRA